MKKLNSTAYWILIIGGINWLLIGLFGWGIGMIFGGQSAIISRVIYIIIGLSAIYLISEHEDCCKAIKSIVSKPEMSKSEESKSEPEIQKAVPASNSENTSEVQ